MWPPYLLVSLVCLLLSYVQQSVELKQGREKLSLMLSAPFAVTAAAAAVFAVLSAAHSLFLLHESHFPQCDIGFRMLSYY